jgi:polysaccharide chain length determinant protein (PEP-CTERM system associated)
MSQSRRSAGSSNSGPNAAKIRDLELQLEELRLQYTDKHPRIGQILDTIELLKEQDAQALANSPPPMDDSSTGPGTSLETNPVYQNMRIQLANIEVDIASLSSQVQEKRRLVTSLKSYADTVPEVEAELGRLNRDYGVIQAKYQQLLEQLETANIGEEADESIDEVQFRVIEPPFARSEPTGPNRPLLLGGSLAFALALGVGLAFIFDQLHPAFFSSRDVNQIAGLPVLGVVGDFHTKTESTRRRNGLFKFGIATTTLIVVFAAITLFADEISPLIRSIVGAVT